MKNTRTPHASNSRIALLQHPRAEKEQTFSRIKIRLLRKIKNRAGVALADECKQQGRNIRFFLQERAETDMINDLVGYLNNISTLGKISILDLSELPAVSIRMASLKSANLVINGLKMEEDLPIQPKYLKDNSDYTYSDMVLCIDKEGSGIGTFKEELEKIGELHLIQKVSMRKYIARYDDERSLIMLSHNSLKYDCDAKIISNCIAFSQSNMRRIYFELSNTYKLNRSIATNKENAPPIQKTLDLLYELGQKPLNLLQPSEPNVEKTVSSFEVLPSNIEADSRRTFMIRNIPNIFTQAELIDLLNHFGLRGYYDFFYLPIDFVNKCNIGYAFINILSRKAALILVKSLDGYEWDGTKSRKVASITYARIQGRDRLIAHFKKGNVANSSDIEDSYLPRVFPNAALDISIF